MHTFFVNTSKKLNTKWHDYLFDCLKADKQVILLDYDMDHLTECSEEIANIIRRDERVFEDYNLIVYAEIIGRNEDAFAAEIATSLKIEEDLITNLHINGKQAGEVLVLFGENFTRGAEYGTGETFERNIKRALWCQFPFYDAEMVANGINRLNKSYRAGKSDDSDAYKNKFQETVTDSNCDLNVIKESSHYYISLVDLMSRTLRDNENISSDELYQILHQRVVEHREHLSKRVAQKDTKYAHFKLLDSDINSEQKSIFTILMFVFLCASKGTIDVVKANEEHKVKSISILGVDTIPEVNWDKLATSLKQKKYILEKEFEQIILDDNEFPLFSESVLADSEVIAPSLERPKLIVKAKAKIGMTVKAMKDAVKDTMDDIEYKNNENEKRIINYITILTEKFNLAKDNKMGSVPYKDPTNSVQSLELTEKYIKDKCDKADARIASRKRLSMSATHIDDIMQHSKMRIDYWFECLRKGKLLFLFAAIFVLCFAIPYGWIQRYVFQTAAGLGVYALSALGFLIVYIIGYLLFCLVFKIFIYLELKNLCNKFAETQIEKEKCMDNYKELICCDIPKSFCLTLYENEFRKYMVSSSLRKNYITYHRNQLEEYIHYIENIISELFLLNRGNEPVPKRDYVSEIILEEDKYVNNQVYCLLDSSDIPSFFL